MLRASHLRFPILLAPLALLIPICEGSLEGLSSPRPPNLAVPVTLPLPLVPTAPSFTLVFSAVDCELYALSVNSPVFFHFPTRTDFRTESSSLYPLSPLSITRRTEKTPQGEGYTASQQLHVRCNIWLTPLPATLTGKQGGGGSNLSINAQSQFGIHSPTGRCDRHKENAFNCGLLTVSCRLSHRGWRELLLSDILSCTHAVVPGSPPNTGIR
jgi:hypothetical protein